MSDYAEGGMSMNRKAVFVLLISMMLAGLIVPPVLSQSVKDRANEAYNPDNLIRLHVIANSNDSKDQELKYRVRDAVVSVLRPELAKLRSRADS